MNYFIRHIHIHRHSQATSYHSAVIGKSVCLERPPTFCSAGAQPLATPNSFTSVSPKAKGKEKKGASEFTMERKNNGRTKQEKKLNLQTKGKKQEKKQRENKTKMGQQ